MAPHVTIKSKGICYGLVWIQPPYHWIVSEYTSSMRECIGLKARLSELTRLLFVD